MTIIYIVTIFIFVFLIMFVFSVCRLTGELSRMEETEFEKCPICCGICGIETTPNDWHDCEHCDATGKISK